MLLDTKRRSLTLIVEGTEAGMTRKQLIERLKQFGCKFEEPIPPRKPALWFTLPNGNDCYADLRDMLKELEERSTS